MGDDNVNTLNESIGNTTHVPTFINILSSHYFHKLIHPPTSFVLKLFAQSDRYPVFAIRKIIRNLQNIKRIC